MTRDEETYPDGETFNPARWLEPEYPTYREPLTVYPKLHGFSQFGFGRRTCQGLPLVEQDLYLAMGGMAWAFDIRKKRGADGGEIPVHWNDYTPLLIAKPMPFEFDAVVRGEDKARRLRRMWEDGRGEDDPVDWGGADTRGETREAREKDIDVHVDVGVKLDAAAAAVDDMFSDRGSETSGPTHSATDSITSSRHSEFEYT